MTDSIATVVQFPSTTVTRNPAPELDPTEPHVQVHCKSQRCNCGRLAQWTEVYECSTKGRSRTLTPVKQMPLFLPYVAIDMPLERTAVCFQCVGTDPGRTSSLEERRRWEETLARKLAQSQEALVPPGESSSKPRISPSLEDL